MTVVQKLKSRFWKNEDGGTAITVSMVLPILLGFGVLAVDVGHFYAEKSRLQQAADLAGLSVLAKMRDDGFAHVNYVSDANADYRAPLREFAQNNLPTGVGAKAIGQYDVWFGKWNFEKNWLVPFQNRAPANAVWINASLSEARGNPVRTFFGKIYQDFVDVRVQTMAVMPVPHSYHILSPDAEPAMELTNSADLDTFTLQVNSDANNALSLVRSFNYGGWRADVTGGAPGTSESRFVTGVDPVGDFLANLPEPPVPGCSQIAYVTTGATPELEPGVYCDGLTITGAESVVLKPGTYVIKGGPLVIDATMAGKTILGEDVLIYLADEQAELQLSAGILGLRAKKTGDWAGVAIMAARGNNAPKLHRITDVNVHLAGIFYTPSSRVEITDGGFNTVCRYLCFVSDTLRISGTLVNSGSSVSTRPSPLGNTSDVPAEPPALRHNMRPYLADKERFGFY
ncbi:MAG: TadE/TadG family type IV pilus assembly protein [Pseudomonadota bacterium]